ncbi:MAG: GNAT family N-acetyltransferase [Betaproteobacteria bacterium]|nr:GNAT family N-acetyltransferase [Betaproteobacteria bacterium]
MSWRLATRADLPEIVEIYNETIPLRTVTADVEPVTVRSREAWFRLHEPGSRPLWVTESGGRVSAWLSFSSFYGRPAYDGTAEISIYVGRSHQRWGIGSFLVREAIREAPDLGLHTLLGFVFADNRPSLATFGSCGFEGWGRLPGVARIDGVAKDLVILGLKLAAGRS